MYICIYIRRTPIVHIEKYAYLLLCLCIYVLVLILYCTYFRLICSAWYSLNCKKVYTFRSYFSNCVTMTTVLHKKMSRYSIRFINLYLLVYLYNKLCSIYDFRWKYAQPRFQIAATIIHLNIAFRSTYRYT